MDEYDRTIRNIAEIDLSFCDKTTVGLHKTHKLLETLKSNVTKCRRIKNISNIKDFLKDLESFSSNQIETIDDDSFKENVQNKLNLQDTTPKRKSNKQPTRPDRKAQSTSEQENKKKSAALIENVKIERISSVEEDTVFYDATLAVKTESESMPPPALPRPRGRPKKEKVSLIEVKQNKQPKKEKTSVSELTEKKQSLRGRKKKVESISRDSDVIYQPSEVVTIDVETDEDLNRNTGVSDEESVDGDYKSKRLPKQLKARTRKYTSKKTTLAREQSESDSQREKSESDLEEFDARKLPEKQSQLETKQIKEPEKIKNASPPRGTIAINKQTDIQEKTTQNIPAETDDQIIAYNTEELVKVKNTAMKVKPPRTKKTKGKARSESKERADTPTSTESTKTETNTADSTFAIINKKAETTIANSTFAVKSNVAETTIANSTFAVISNVAEMNTSNFTFAVTDKSDTNSTFAVQNKDTETNPANITYAATSAVNKNVNNNVNGTFVITNDNSSQVNGTFVVDSDRILNETNVIPDKLNQAPQIKSTVVLEKAISKVRQNSSGSVYEDALEQIQSEVKVTKGAVKKQVNKGPKPVFSPFANSPVKKRVEAFEKLRAETAMDSQTRMTRTKTRNKAKIQQQEQQDVDKNSKIPILGTASRMCTPSSSNRYLPSNPSYYSCKATKSVCHTPLPSTKTMSALKASQQEFREKEQRRKEKEEEASRKKEQMLKAQMEEKKKKREERELKAKQQRDAQEKEKRKMLESQAQKEEKLKRQLADKQEKLARMREASERKRLLVKQKNEELKKAEEQRQTDEENRKLESLKWIKQEEERMRQLEERRRLEEKTPLYRVAKMPLLPTYDCYDSDDEEGQKKTAFRQKPDWLRSEQMQETLRCMDCISNKLKNTYFCLKPQTANLREIFEIIDPTKLKRNSSAVWKHPPRFTLMPTLRNSDDDSDNDSGLMVV